MSLAILFHFLCAQHVSDINISIIRSLRICCWVTKLVLLFLVRCVLEFRRGWVGVVSVLQVSACNTDTTQTQPHQIFDTKRTKNKSTDVVIQQNSRKLLMMDILMSETCWVHKKWNKIASDIKLVFHSSDVSTNFDANETGLSWERLYVTFIYLHITQDRRTEQINTSRRTNENHKKLMARHVMDHECLRDACPVATTASAREIKCLIFNFRLWSCWEVVITVLRMPQNDRRFHSAEPAGESTNRPAVMRERFWRSPTEGVAVVNH